MSITGYTQLDDGLGECSALDQIKANGITTGRTSNFGAASIIRRENFSGSGTTVTSTLTDLFPPLTATKCSIAWVYVSVFAVSTYATDQYFGIRVLLLDDIWDRYIYPSWSVQNGPFFHSISLKPITQNTGNGARVTIATNYQTATVNWKVSYLEYK